MNDIHVEQSRNNGIINCPTKLHLVGHFCKICIKHCLRNSISAACPAQHIEFSYFLVTFCLPYYINPLNPESNPMCCLLALLGAHHFLHVSRIRVKSLNFRRLMSYIYIYGAPILDVSRSHTTTQHSR